MGYLPPGDRDAVERVILLLGNEGERGLRNQLRSWLTAKDVAYLRATQNPT